MKGTFIKIAAMAVMLSSGLVWAQKQPKPKSQKEVDAIMAMQNAPDPDSRIKAAKDLIVKFADTEFKPFALQMIVQSYQQKNDIDNTIVSAEQLLEADPKSYIAQLAIAGTLAQKTREFDLDKEEKLSRAEKMALGAIESIKVAEKINPQVPDAQWESFKKDQTSEAYQAMGLIAMVRKKYDAAAKSFKDSVDVAATPDPATMVRLAAAYNLSGKPAEALPILDKVLGTPGLHPAIKQFADQEKARSVAATKK